MNMYRNAAVVLICVALAYCTNGGWTRVGDPPAVSQGYGETGVGPPIDLGGEPTE